MSSLVFHSMFSKNKLISIKFYGLIFFSSMQNCALGVFLFHCAKILKMYHCGENSKLTGKNLPVDLIFDRNMPLFASLEICKKCILVGQNVKDIDLHFFTKLVFHGFLRKNC